MFIVGVGDGTGKYPVMVGRDGKPIEFSSVLSAAAFLEEMFGCVPAGFTFENVFDSAHAARCARRGVISIKNTKKVFLTERW